MPRTVFASVDIPALRTRLGLTTEQLPDDATDEQVNEVLSTLPSGTNPETPAPALSPEGAEPGSPEAGAPVAGEPSEGGGDRANPTPGTELSASGVTIDRVAFDQLQADAAAGRAARDEQIAARRREFIASAVRAGRIPPARREHYLALMSRDEQGTTEFINSIPEGTVPVNEVGQSGDPTSLDSGSEYPQEWLSDGERAKIAAARAGQPLTTRVVSEA